MSRDLDIVIVTYNSMLFVDRLATSCASNKRIASIVVVDNSPDERTAEAVRAANWGRELRLVRRSDNPGFGAAVNAGVEAASGAEYLALVNPDVMVDDAALGELIEAVASDPLTAVVGAQLVTSAGAPVSSAREFPSASSILRRHPVDVRHNGRLVEADWICGALMVWRSADFRAVGGFDDRYFLYYEDVDICRRLKSAGRRVKIAGHLQVIHDQGHGVSTPPHLRRIDRASRRAYARRWLGWRGRTAARAADAIDLAKSTARKALR